MFIDRNHAGKQLAEKLLQYKKQDAVVLALPRGGVVVGFPIAEKLQLPLDVIIARKLGSPHDSELGVGAIAEEGVLFWDNTALDSLQIPQRVLRPIQEKESLELERRIQLYRKGKALPLLTNKIVILIDDGLATGVTAHAALLSIKKHHPKKIIFASPVCAQEASLAICPLVDTIIYLQSPEYLETIGEYYHDFHQVTDEEVLTLLNKIKIPRVTHTTMHDFSQKILW